MKLNTAWIQRLPASDRIFRRVRDSMLDRIDNIQGYCLNIEDPFGKRSLGKRSNPTCMMRVKDSSFYPRLLASGSVALGETYAEGLWTANNLDRLLSALAVNRDVWINISNYNPLNIVNSIVHWTNKNTLDGSNENISKHYDLGNDFYQLFLDETLTYSSAYFTKDEEELEVAQKNKLDRICQKLELKPEHHLLEIGTGWGSFALFAAREYGTRVTTTTISDNQYEYVNRKVNRLGLNDEITVMKKDYRELTGEYDRIVSIEMIEAVGEEYLDNYISQLDELLRPGGRILLQSILMQEQFYEAYRNSVDFIQRYIFPGGHLPSTGKILSHLKQSSLVLDEFEQMGSHYSETLKRWDNRFKRKKQQITSSGFDEYFFRLWRYYFNYCIAGFESGLIGNAQLTLSRPDILK